MCAFTSARYIINDVLISIRFSTPHKAFLTAITSAREQTNYAEAFQDEKLKGAMTLEIDAQKFNKTFLIVDLPPGKTTLGYQWMFKIKHHSNRAIERYKARLVVQGNRQEEGVDYD